METSYIYIVSNKHRTVLYIGVTSNLRNRIAEHKEGTGSSFTTKYKVTDLVYFEEFIDINEAISREKQLKNWHREWKINLIKEMNPEMTDLFWDL